MNYMNWDNILDFAFVNTDTLAGDPKGIVVNFHGYTDGTMFDKSNAFAEYMGKNGIVFVFPYYSVWAWRSRSSQAYIEEVLDVVFEHFGFDENTPFVTAGGSMGGMTAVLYGLYGKRKTVACAMNCPVTDMRRLVNHQNIRAIYSAFILENKPLSECIDENSPILLCDKLPDIPYYAVFGSNDGCIVPDMAKSFSDAMIKAGKDYRSKTVDGMGHCDLPNFREDFEKYLEFIKTNICGI